MKLHSRVQGLALERAQVLRVSENPDLPSTNEVLLLKDTVTHKPTGFGAVLTRSRNENGISQIPEELHYLGAGDIIRVSSNGEVFVLYRKTSRHNAMLVTERCNSKCLMCSQPPRDINDDYLIDDWLIAIPMMSPETTELGITGGEPTLRFPPLLKLIEATKSYLPKTSLHMLSNGRLFSYLQYARAIAHIGHGDFMIGIPLYSDIDSNHDYVVQAKGAFAQTVRGILNLGRVNQKVEIRVVIHQQTYKRLPQLARFIARNLPFASHVALMGLEITGYTRPNLSALWIDPVDYQKELEQAVDELIWGKMRFSIYNLPLCLLPQSLWPYAQRSISDWKNIYFEPCEKCLVREYCGGFFASAVHKRSMNVHCLGESERKYAASLWNESEECQAPAE